MSVRQWGGLLGARQTGLLAVLALGALSACATAPAAHVAVSAPVTAPPQMAATAPHYQEVGTKLVGTASWYRPGRGLHRTCTGEPFTGASFTAASPYLPLGSEVRVADVADGRSIVVRVNDCMPHGGRLIDLSEAAAEQLGLVQAGVEQVSVTRLALVSQP
ncbi:septal ring lytic transglycosylase RlpA family protein [Acidocella sp.]|uniref:septal ring lytic transglycosylase RlpA family protein n=1 Tax=Acidocella sp. TaxID=50710 RepID=UPI002611B2D4|nr:septal ring lytic transglycosylase RlpA family protein [Acidocella sp.]